MRSYFCILALCAALTACGGGAGGDSSGTSDMTGVPSDSVGVISGKVVVANELRGATVSVRNYSTGELIGSGYTDQNGAFEVNLTADGAALLLVEASGGHYVEPSSGTTVALGSTQTMRTAIDYAAASRAFAVITPYTNLASGLAAYRAKGGMNTAEAIAQSNEEIGEWLGFDAIVVAPRDITNPANVAVVLGDEHSYGLINAAISSWTKYASSRNGKTHDELSSISFGELMYRDVIADGLLDGRALDVSGAPIAISFDGISLNRDVYRYGLAAHLVAITNDTAINKTTLTEPAVLRFAKWYAEDTCSIWAAATPPSFTNGRPEISFTVPALNQIVRGAVVPVTSNVASLGAIETATLEIDGTVVGSPAANPASPSFSFNSQNYSDGVHILKISVRDSLGVTNSNTLAVRVDNTTPTVGVAFTTPTPNQTIRGSSVAVYGSVSPGFGQAVSAALTVDDLVVGGPAANPASPSFILNSKNYSDGLHTLGISVIDSYGIPARSSISVRIDNTTPTVAVSISSPTSGSWVSGASVPVIADVSGLGVPVAAANLTIDGAQVASMSNSGTTHSAIFDSTHYAFGGHVIEVGVLDAFGIPANSSIVVNVDNNSPALTYTGWTAAVTYGPGATMSGTATDQGAGVDSVFISIPGYPTSRAYPDPQGNWTLSTVFWTGGVFKIEVRDRVGNCSRYSAPLTTYVCPTLTQFQLNGGPGCVAPNTYLGLPISAPFTLVSSNYSC